MYSALADIHYCVQIGLIYSRDIYALANYPVFFPKQNKGGHYSLLSQAFQRQEMQDENFSYSVPLRLARLILGCEKCLLLLDGYGCGCFGVW